MKVTFEGTAEEIAKLLPTIKANLEVSGTATSRTSEVTPENAEADWSWVSTEVARRMIGRRYLDPKQKAVLVALYNEHPRRVPVAELQKLVDYSPQQFAGLMGALGRRLTKTPGYVDNSWFFDRVWDEDNRCYTYSVPDTVLAAIEAEGLVS
jgi:hypothetical protein